MAKILLIRIALKNKTTDYLSPPLGLMYIAAYLLQDNKHTVTIIDQKACNERDEIVFENLIKINPDFIGLSALTTEMHELHQMAAKIRGKKYRKYIVVGGAHASAWPEDVLSDSNIDFAIIGEGEKSFTDLIEALENKTKRLEDIGGLAFKDKLGVVRIISKKNIENLNQLPLPRWDLIDIEKYSTGGSFNGLKYPKRHMSLITSRGCPFQCNFCHNIFGKEFRYRDPENVLLEIMTLYHQYDIRYFEIIDDCFNFDVSRMIKICDLIINEKVDITLLFPNGLRGDILTDKLIEKLYLAGTRMISFAPESGSESVQRRIGKNINLSKLQNTISNAVKIGIHSHGFFILGFPGEGQDDLNKTLHFAVNSDLHTASFFMLNPFPGTKVYESLRNEGKINVLNFSEQNYNNLQVAFGEVDSKTLVLFQRKCFFKFYFNRKRVINIFKGPIVKLKDFYYYFRIFIKRAVFREN